MNVRKIPDTAVQHNTAKPYSPVITVKDGTLICLSGQAPLDKDGNTVGKTIEEQTEVTLKHCKQLLEDVGCTFDNVTEVTVYLSDLSELPRFNQVYEKCFNLPFPTRTAVGVALLNDFKVEVTMRAIKYD